MLLGAELEFETLIVWVLFVRNDFIIFTSCILVISVVSLCTSPLHHTLLKSFSKLKNKAAIFS